MKDGLLKLGKFLHIIDDDDRLNLSDIAFIVIMTKIALAPALDFPSVITLATVLINKMHKRQQESILIADISEVKNVVKQVSPVVDKIKEVLK